MKLLRNYIFWAYERGSFHYDVMVTLILLFIFVAPHYIDFKDKPVKPLPIHSSEVLVREAGSVGHEARFVYEIRAEDLHDTGTEAGLRTAVLSVVEPIAGEVTLEKVTPVMDVKGKVVAYDATVLR